MSDLWSTYKTVSRTANITNGITPIWLPVSGSTINVADILLASTGEQKVQFNIENQMIGLYFISGTTIKDNFALPIHGKLNQPLIGIGSGTGVCSVRVLGFEN